MENKSTTERFEDKYEPVTESGCWLWTGALSDHRGYGRFFIKGKNEMAHRASYMIHVGNIPDGLIIRHECDNPYCVNPNHLIAGTHKDNSEDMVKRDRHNNQHKDKEYCRKGHKFSKENTYIQPKNGGRVCRTCKKLGRPKPKGQRNGNTDKTHCKRGHEFTKENTYITPSSGSRICKSCQEDHKRKYIQKRREKCSSS